MKAHMSFMKLEDFKQDFPKLAELVQKQKFVESGYYVYHLTKGGNVERQAIVDNPTYFKRWSVPIEYGQSRKINVRSAYAQKITIDTEQLKLSVSPKESVEAKNTK